jgi:hypothetical protein
MAIDIKNEHLISIDQAAGMIPGRDGPTVHTATVRRWTKPPGLRGVVLENLLCGPRRCTSVEAVQRFLDKVTERVARPSKVESTRTASRTRLQATRRKQRGGRPS